MRLGHDPAHMKRSLTLLLATTAALRPCVSDAQVFDFTFDDGVNFDMTGWAWFCSLPEFYPGAAAPGGGAYSLQLPANDQLTSMCFANGELVGVHHLLPGIQTGVSYDLTFWSYIDAFNQGGDIGFFAYYTGQTPTDFGSVVATGAPIFPVWDAPAWIQNVDPFTLPAAWSGMDVYLFIEYSSAPDPPMVPKFYDSIHIAPSVGTGIPGTASTFFQPFPDPAVDHISIALPPQAMSVVITDVEGRIVEQVEVSGTEVTFELSVNNLATGIYSIRLLGDGSTEVGRFMKQ